MATFVIETYLSRARASEVEAETARIRAAIAGLTIDPAAPEQPVRWLLTYFVPDDEMCLHVIEAASAAVAMRVSALASLTPERVVEADATVNEIAVAHPNRG
ncbi:MAG TPA: hypothetical protein VFO05_01685 [Candidatus Limnocylindrales bacterium]|nr:hypothetical protein [Candidatus Limnocylindrales bacterium]